MRTTVSLPDPLLDNARQSAAERGITFSIVVEDALRLLLAKSPVAAVAPFRLHTVRGKLVDPDLDLSRTSVLAVQEDELSFRHRELSPAMPRPSGRLTPAGKLPSSWRSVRRAAGPGPARTGGS